MISGSPVRIRRVAFGWVCTTAAAVVAVTAPLICRGPDLVLWNASASVPVGLYLVQPDARLRAGDLAVADLPQPARQIAANRQYLPAGVLLIKPVAALPGARVCRYGPNLFIDGVRTAVALKADRRHRDLPRWQGCQIVRQDQVFLANPQVADSFDGRYFGPIAQSLVHGRAWPLLTFREKTST